MPLSEEQNERLALLLDGLQAVRGQLSDRSRSFVDDQVERHAKYGQSMFLSPRQEKWLLDLHREFVGGEPGAVEASQRTPQEETSDNLDDEIPF